MPDISCELSARQTIHMKCQVLFSVRITEKLECHLLQFHLISNSQQLSQKKTK